MATAPGLVGEGSLHDMASAHSINNINQRRDTISSSFALKYRFMPSARSPPLHPPIMRIPRSRLPPEDPGTPTPAALSSAGFRAKSWAVAAVKTAKSVEILRSKKSFGGLRKIRKRRRSTNYNLVSIGHENPRSFSSGAVNQHNLNEAGFSEPSSFSLKQPKLRTPTQGIPPLSARKANKALPSEKPLPQTPDAKPDPELSPATSRSLIDAEDRPLRHSPPGMPGVQEEWPILAPLKATDSANKEDNGCQLTSMTSTPSATTPCGVKMFSDAANKLSESFATASIAAQEPVSEKSDTGVPAEETSQPQKTFTVTEPGTPNAPSFGKSNPFRNKSRAFGALGSPPTTPVNRNFSYTFDSQRRPAAMCGLHDSSVAEKSENFSSKESTTDTLIPPDKTGSVSKIPRISPTSAIFSGLANRPISPAFSPSHRSSIPLPSRLLHTHKHKQPPMTPINRNTAIVSGNLEQSIASTADHPKQPEADEFTHEELSFDIDIATDSEESDYHFEGTMDAESITEGGVRVKQLSHLSPSTGPQLRISPEAERVIMGGDEELTSERAKLPAQGRWRLDARREFRISTDSLFGGFGAKRDWRTRPTSSMDAISTQESTVETRIQKTIPKVKSADLNIHSHSPSGNSTENKNPPGNNSNITPTGRTSNNPFFNRVISKSSTFIVKNENRNKEPKSVKNNSPCVEKLGQDIASSPAELPKEANARKASPKPIKKFEISPSNSKQTPERSEIGKRPYAMRRGSPRNARPHRVPTHRSPDKMVRQQSSDLGYQSKSKVTRAMPMSAAVQDNNRIHDVVGGDGTPHGRHSHGHAHGIASQGSAKPKSSGTKGVLSNFRGLFTKHKAESLKENPIHTPSHQNERISRKSRVSLKGERSITRSPVRYYQAIFGTDREVQASQELRNHGATASGNPSVTQVAPAFADTRNVSGLAMEVLDSARAEPDAGKKEQLVRLGSYLIEALNHSNDAEKAMITAIQAAKQAEISCALAKENALRIGQVARGWLGDTNSGQTA
ncbi:hypothetical protein PRK78_000140 [Emydomyces testavorans]|uniref:Uncharacterized protein n=1 Tax=Emydomyces testavorans TaxID=2070801 RepID=A0AAF0IFA1_9EURO|nr:hypothetical protein PRK78_000140 [Emydomyces testavorans]